ncbi:M3 family oligoendopeptidase [Helicobacter kayseriensis]|uniref:M3 family oligoendopeptidase n=1 Tax=Helicobacter kayseriensis TaxID=2905877 RepID=UPI001E47D551|nr:M3 family oligoendopeptidase [Helicobacter kayseriensis]MCE3046807.1 M3 family oligoendopeptidase [Helicobacter kayseriensis]MCE3047891.1 M3 family oligoendopeptidase [Helicobacter kayseriensis]
MQHHWNLNSLFSGTKELEQKTQELTKRAQIFQTTYQGKLQENFAQALKEYEEILEQLGGIQTYVFLLFAQDCALGDVYAKYEMLCNQIRNFVLFFELEYCALDEKVWQQHQKELPQYAHFLSNLTKEKPHQLGLDQEKIILELSPVGAGAFARFFDEYFSQMKFKIQDGKKQKKVGEEEMLAYLHSSDRNERKKAHKIFTKKLKKSSHFLTYVLNMIRKDLAINVKLRGYEKPESFRHLDNCATQKSVDSLVKVTQRHYGLVEKYYFAKKDLLGLKELKDYDRYAPILSPKDEKIPYQDALNMVLESFRAFSPLFFEITQKALQEGWVDSHPRERKRGGAFSHGCIPSAHPYVLLNYTQGRRDIFTIAHEFGHMIHQELSKSQGYLNMDTPLTTAETASVFAEMLLFDHLKEKIPQEELLGLYAGKLEDIFSTLFRQIVMTCFERRIHDNPNELKTQDFNLIWREENQKMFGKSVKLTKKYDYWWSYIPHFIHSPFYCYAYSYGQLLVLALYGLYKQSQEKGEEEIFIKQYIHFLSSGGNQSPKDLIAKFGFDVESEDFWLVGIRQIERLLEEFLALKTSLKG